MTPEGRHVGRALTAAVHSTLVAPFEQEHEEADAPVLNMHFKEIAANHWFIGGCAHLCKHITGHIHGGTSCALCLPVSEQRLDHAGVSAPGGEHERRPSSRAGPLQQRRDGGQQGRHLSLVAAR